MATLPARPQFENAIRALGDELHHPLRTRTRVARTSTLTQTLGTVTSALFGLSSFEPECRLIRDRVGKCGRFWSVGLADAGLKTDVTSKTTHD